MSDLKFIQNSFLSSAQNFERLSKNQDVHLQIEQAAKWMVETIQKKGKILLAGNGGSAADAQHIAAELVAKLSKDRTSIPALSLCVDSSLITAIGNDYGYDFVFDRQIQGLAQSNDLFFAITTSGNSGNILKALERCRMMKIRSILLTGFQGGKAKSLADLIIVAPGEHTAQVQEAHIAIYHTLCFMLENALVESGHVKYF